MSTDFTNQSGQAAPATGAPARTVRATFDGEPIEVPAGASVAAALISDGLIAWRDTRGGAKRGLFCGIGVCFDCLVEIDGESGQRACMIPLEEGMRVCSAKGPTAHDHVASSDPGSDVSEARELDPSVPASESGDDNATGSDTHAATNGEEAAK